MADKPKLDGVIAAAKQAPGRGLPPVHLWNPAHSGEIDIVIKPDGRWIHEGAVISREALVRLFSTVLRKDPDGFWLVTPVEKMRITVEDAPFVAVRVDRDGEDLKFLTNVGDEVIAGPEHTIRVEVAEDGEPRPYLHVRRGLEALINRPVFYELVEMAEETDTPDGPTLGVSSGGAWPGRPGAGARPVNDVVPPRPLHEWIANHLDPLDDHAVEGGQRRSDFDLTPGGWPGMTEGPLKAAAVLVALVEREAGLTVILTKRSEALRSHTGQVALPGGRQDEGERPVETALREAHEEVGLEPHYVVPVGLSTPYHTGSGYLITPVVAFVRPGFTLTPNPDEVADIFETPFFWLMDPANYEEHERELPTGEKRRFYATTHDDRYIWGATAGILRALHERLYGAALG